MDHEKLLKAYIRHVIEEEGTPFLNTWDREMFSGITDEEFKYLVGLGDEVYSEYKEIK